MCFRLLVRSTLVTALVTLAACHDASRSANPAAPSAMGGAAGMAGMGMRSHVTSEFEYLAQMIPHHEEAITSAQQLARGTSRAEMRAFAESIIVTQSAEVARMREWLARWYPTRDPRVTYVPMMGDFSSLRGDALDRAFLESMIPHHMMAIMMSQQLLASGLAVHAEIVPFATEIRDMQRREVATMQAWLRIWFGVSGPMLM